MLTRAGRRQVHTLDRTASGLRHRQLQHGILAHTQGSKESPGPIRPAAPPALGDAARVPRHSGRNQYTPQRGYGLLDASKAFRSTGGDEGTRVRRNRPRALLGGFLQEPPVGLGTGDTERRGPRKGRGVPHYGSTPARARPPIDASQFPSFRMAGHSRDIYAGVERNQRTLDHHVPQGRPLPRSLDQDRDGKDAPRRDRRSFTTRPLRLSLHFFDAGCIGY